MKKTICIATVIMSLLSASCSKKQDYTCQCYGGFTGGPTETVVVKSTDKEQAQQMCAALADPPTNSRNSCSLQ
jgi:hypothetical protein